MERDDEVSGAGNSYTTEFRQYDSRLGRWLSLDPLMAKYPHQSPYVAFNNNPIYFIDPNGLEAIVEVDKENKTMTVTSTYYYDKSDERFSGFGVFESIKGYDPLIYDANGWDAKERSFTDGDGVVWTVNYNIEYVGLDSKEQVDQKLKEDPSANRFAFRSSYIAGKNNSQAGHWNSSTRTLELSVYGRVDGSTMTHELGHSMGLPHEEDNYYSPNFNVVGNLSGTNEDGGIMSYSYKREIKDYEIKQMLESASMLAKKQTENCVNLLIYSNPYKNGGPFSFIKVLNE